VIDNEIFVLEEKNEAWKIPEVEHQKTAEYADFYGEKLKKARLKKIDFY